MNIVDLHVHSNKSDGSLTPTELVHYALEKGLSAFALTDHDTTAGIEEALAAVKGKPIEVIPGIEFSTEYEGKDIHILGLYINCNAPVFKAHIQSFVDSRILRNQKMCARLQEAGIDISYEKLLSEFPGAVITRAHYARFLLKYGYVKSLPEAFDRYVGDHCPYFVPREKVTPKQAVKLILEADGVPILAHPVLYHMSDARLDKLVASLKEAGLVGLEAVYATYNASEERQMRALASKYDLLISGGSDFHGAAKPKLDLATGYGKLVIPEDILLNIKKEHNKNTKIFFTDLDGTLLNDAKEITPKTRKALDTIAANGHKLVLISGRPVLSVLEVKETLHLDYPGMYIIAYNGGCIYDCDNDRLLLEKRVSLEDAAHLVEASKQAGLYCQTYTDTHIITSEHGPELDYYTKTIHLPYHITEDVIGMLDKPPYKLHTICLDDRSRLEAFCDSLSTWAENRIQMIFSNDKYLELIPYDSGKGFALKYLSEYLGVAIENTLSAGDADNDISMIEAAGTGVAMLNGAQSVKDIADVITPADNNNDGLAEILSSFFTK
ncbi:MAG: Cof-type HAD-IIB family hydrolase [Lachnospiraceae bacterium]|nr:Cof-type HAD-IIB family hydrolase [Lachnospiraceae bacterium]